MTTTDNTDTDSMWTYLLVVAVALVLANVLIVFLLLRRKARYTQNYEVRVVRAQKQKPALVDIDINELAPLEKLNESAQMCSVCLDVMEEGEEVRKLKCGHAFHPPCVEQWCSRSQTCPMCRMELVERPEENKEDVVSVEGEAVPEVVVRA